MASCIIYRFSDDVVTTIIVVYRSGPLAIWAYHSWSNFFFLDSRGSIYVSPYIGVGFNGGNTVPGDRVLFVFMVVTLGEGLYRLLYVLHINRLGLTNYYYSTLMYGQGYDLLGKSKMGCLKCSPSFFCYLRGKSEKSVEATPLG